MNFLLRVEWERNVTAIFISSIPRPVPTYFGLEWSHNGIFWFFDSFFSFFGIFYYSSNWNGTERQFLFSLFLGLFKPILGWKVAITGFFNFLNFFPIFFELSLIRWIETKRNETIIFIFSLFQRFPIRFGLKYGHNGIFQFLEFFCYFFGIFYYASIWNGTER